MNKLLIAIILNLLMASAMALEQQPLVAGVAASSIELSDADIQIASKRRVYLVLGDNNSPLAGGLKQLAKSSPKYNLIITSAWSAPNKGGGVFTNKASTSLRIDRAVESLNSSYVKSTNIDTIALDLTPQVIPSGRRIEAPYIKYNTNMEINLTSSSFNGSTTDYINAPTSTTGSASFPIELPGLTTVNIHTGVSVPSGSSPDVTYIPSARNPRQALVDIIQGMGVVANTKRVQPIFFTLPLTTSKNLQRNWYNNEIRLWCIKNKQPLLDIAEIEATGSSGELEVDSEGPRLAASWTDKDSINDEGKMRIAKAWWWLAAKL